MKSALDGKRILIVDDEPDVLETLLEILDMCVVDSAPDFETAQKFLSKNSYDLAILDIMGVRGYDLLELANEKKIPALMLTAHAVSPENLVKSIKGGAQSYVPKDKISDITDYVTDILESREEGGRERPDWLSKLEPYFDKRFGDGWKERDREFWDVYDRKYRAGKKEVEKML
ncbi:MAG: response regulator [Deltaproteobacteria bacterium]|nr:response regulator [Deltaproteobacteria bacterium]MBW2047070.1 response regulator [Deltaproteobacteria bacterium]MBW2351611.1 response regulator [Deltaproteobacteria bacterium]HDZ89387.1 response regulator [Deltaproteobacteria bacterium]